MKQFFFIIILFFSFNFLFAQQFDYNGIRYNITSINPYEVEVISKTGGYSGTIVIPEQVFYNTLTFTVKSIGQDAFKNCFSLYDVTIGNQVEKIKYQAFRGCTGLSSIIIPNSVDFIANSAFAFCAGLTTLTIPSSVTFIEDMAFWACIGLTSINVDLNNNNYSSLDGVLFNKNKTTLLQYPVNKNDTIYEIPNSVTNIGHRAFNYADKLTSIIIPNMVTNIGHRAFNDCNGLTSIICCATTPPILYNNNAFEGLWTILITLYVPNGSVASYNATNVWKDFIVTGTINCSTVDVNYIESESIKVYPNPICDVINIEIPEGEFGYFELYDINGRKLLSKSINKSEVISADWLKKGIYMYSITINESKTVGKIIKE